MALYTLKNIKLSDISDTRTLSFRYSLIDEKLKESIRKIGIITPLTVTGAASRVLVSGNKRYFVAKELGIKEIPVFEITEKKEEKDLFLMAVISNWNQNFSELDLAKALCVAKEHIGFSEKEILEDVMPLFSLKSDLNLYRNLMQINYLHKSLMPFVDKGIVPLKIVSGLLKFSGEDQEILGTIILSKIKFSVSQFSQSLEWLYDMFKVSGSNLQNFLKENDLFSVLEHPAMDPRVKADKIFKVIKNVRYPSLAKYEKTFYKISSKIIGEMKDVRLETTPAFENEGFMLHANMRDPKSLDRILNRLKLEQSSLNSLFDIKL